MADTRWLFVSDTQFPKHDPRMISMWFDVLRWMKPQAIDLLGDIDDADGTSRWVTGTPREGFSPKDPGVVMTKEFLADIHKISPKADKHFHDGNHGWYRHRKWLEKNNPQALEDKTFSADGIYEFSKSGFEWHDYDKPPVKRYGDIFAHHGEAISKHAGESVRNDCLKWGVSLVRGHSHRQGEYFQTFPLDNRRVRGYEIGHMCDYNQMEYVVVPDWQAGFAVGTVHNGEVFIDTIEISPNYVCVVNGKVFQG